MSVRTETIHGILSRWLDRYSPPQGMKDNPQAIQDEAEALLRVLLRFAPREAYDMWVRDALDRCAYTMKTRAWPTVGDLGAACSNLRKDRRTEAASAGGDDMGMIDRMADWHAKFGDQLPGYGRPERTAELVARGVLRDLREARFRGYALDDRQRAEAMSQPPGDDEWRHHVTVMARIKGISFAECDATERQRSGISRHSVGIPSKRVEFSGVFE
jgi:hypothetical protein